MTLAEMAQALRSGGTTAEALARLALRRIQAVDHRIDAFITVTPSRALADARLADGLLARGMDRGPLHGIPIALKDIFDTAGIRTTCHSKLREDHVPAEDSFVAARLAAAGAVLLGKLGTHEFAVGGPSHDLPFPPPRNPWNRDHVPGGSSSGAGAAIAAGMVRVAMGSDTGGSIRHPAAYCGVVGLKPTYGRISRRGVAALSWSMDHCGPMGRSVEDVAILLGAVAGHDSLDPGSADVPVGDYRAELERGVAGLRLGVPRAWLEQTAGPVREGIERVLATLAEAGARVVDVDVPDLDHLSACGRVILAAEAFAAHAADLRARPGDYGRIAFTRLAAGAALTAEDLVQAQRLRGRLTEQMNRAFDQADALICPNVMIEAPRFDALPDAMAPGAPMQMIQFNVTGHPALAVPIGLGPGGLPIGLQVAGRGFDEAMVLRVGRAVEALSGWESVALPVVA
jgi:aspartyl-tRNA(Asn)/glutamyl-tRNA(Gln) amidotransferase subunit A